VTAHCLPDKYRDLRPPLDDADIEAEEILCLMLREGQHLEVRRKIAQRLREFREMGR
jgi:hypothetical protein